jgi:hypothetical protein
VGGDVFVADEQAPAHAEPGLLQEVRQGVERPEKDVVAPLVQVYVYGHGSSG